MKPGFTDEYAEPHIYDAEYGSYREDFTFFLNLLSQGEILDLACGTGRLTIPLAKSGLQVTGLDKSRAMLSRAKENGKDLDIHWIHGDITGYELDKSFDLITLAGNSFQALLTPEEQQKLFSCVKNHLKPSGLFAFDTRNPSAHDLSSTSNFDYWHSFTNADGEAVTVQGKQNYDTDHQIITYTTKRVWPDHKTQSNIQLRFSSFEEIVHAIHKSGMQLVNVYGDYQKSTFTENSPSIIVVCS